jgi:hypothetical protein
MSESSHDSLLSVTSNISDVTPLEKAQAQIRILELENAELKARCEFLENPTPQVDSFVSERNVPSVYEQRHSPTAQAPVFNMPNFSAMTQREQIEFGRKYGIDILKCQTGHEMVEKLKKGYRVLCEKQMREEKQVPFELSNVSATTVYPADVVAAVVDPNLTSSQVI